MKPYVEIEFASLEAEPSAGGGANHPAVDGGTLAVFVGGDLKPGVEAARMLGSAVKLIESAASTAQFKGKIRTALDILGQLGAKRQSAPGSM